MSNSEYQRPPGFEPSGASFEEAMAAALGEMPRGEPALVEHTPEPEPAPPPPPPPPVAPEPPKQPEPAKASDASLQHLMEREARVLEREEAFKQNEPYLRELQERLDRFEAAQRSFYANPSDYIRTIAPDMTPDEVARLLWFEQLGDRAPAEHRLHKEVRGTKSELQQLRDEIQAERQRHAEELARKQTEEATRQYVGTVPDENQLLKSLATSNPDMATRMLLDARRMAEARGESITPVQAAALVEQYLSQFAPIYAPPAPPAEPPKDVSPPTSLRNEHTRVQPSLSPESDADPNVLRRRALVAAGYDPENPAFKPLFE